MDLTYYFVPPLQLEFQRAKNHQIPTHSEVKKQSLSLSSPSFTFDVIASSMDGYHILVTGAASGIGKEFVCAFLETPSNHVVAIDRNFPNETLPCNQAAFDAYHHDVGDDTVSRIMIVSMDLTDEMRLLYLSRFQSLKMVIHCAGVRGLVPSVPISKASDVAEAETIDVMTSETMQRTFHINTVGTFLLLRATIPSLRSNQGKAIIMGSRMGSVHHNSTGGGYAYRAAKAALNAVVKSFSLDEPDIIFTVVHPGRVETDLVGAGVIEDGAITAKESVKDMLGLISSLKKADSGSFVDRFGEDIPY